MNLKIRLAPPVFLITALMCSCSRSTEYAKTPTAKSPVEPVGTVEFNQALQLVDGPKEAETIRLLQAAVSKGNTNAQLVLGIVQKSKPEVAIGLIRDSATSGNVLAQAFYGNELMVDGGIFPKKALPKDLNEGIRWLQLSAEKGCALAALGLGNYYQTSPPGDAQKWYEIAAQRFDYFEKDFDPFNAYDIGRLKPVSADPEPTEESILYSVTNRAEKVRDGDSPAPKLVVSLRKLMRGAVITSQKALGSMEADRGEYQAAMRWYAIVERETGVRVGLPINADRLFLEYQANEIRADAAFKKQMITISGRVIAVGKDVLGHPYIALNSGEDQIASVQCMLGADAVERAAKLNPGEFVTLTGRVEGRMMNVLVGDCSFQNQ